ncbi:MAG TPA: hypothetical protein VNO52_12730, partial [Methylomirabilota bacterium]|nr:hypothetical protein [Methylomirabilota bacterium]
MMNRRGNHGPSLILIGVVQFLLAVSLPADSLHWRTNENRVDADVGSWKVIDVLERVSRATGWKIFVDPEAARWPVNARFRDRPPDKALDSLLGNLNRALLPPTNGSAPRLLVFRTFEAQATQAVRDASTNPPPAHLTRELIVQLKPGANIDEIARRFGAKVIGRNEELNAYRLEFESEEAANAAREALRQHEDVASVDLNYPVYRDPSLETSLAGSSYDLNPKADPNCDHIIVGLIDTALHASGGNNSFVLPQISVAGEAGPPGAGPSHGDAMSQTALKGTSYVLKPDEGARVRILPINVYGDRATTSTFDVANGIHTAINKGAMIINLSLGAPGGTKVLQDVIQKGHRQGV